MRWESNHYRIAWIRWESSNYRIAFGILLITTKYYWILLALTAFQFAIEPKTCNGDITTHNNEQKFVVTGEKFNSDYNVTQVRHTAQHPYQGLQQQCSRINYYITSSAFKNYTFPTRLILDSIQYLLLGHVVLTLKLSFFFTRMSNFLV